MNKLYKSSFFLIAIFLVSSSVVTYAFNCEATEWLQPGEGVCDAGNNCCGNATGDTTCDSDGFCGINEGSSCFGYENECVSGSVCENGACIPESSECLPIGGTGCVPGGSGDEECCLGTCSVGGNGNSQCVLVPEGGVCNVNEDCQSGLECIGGYCGVTSGAAECGTAGTIGKCGDIDVACPVGTKCKYPGKCLDYGRRSDDLRG